MTSSLGRTVRVPRQAPRPPQARFPGGVRGFGRSLTRLRQDTAPAAHRCQGRDRLVRSPITMQKNSQDAQKGPDARRRPTAAREAYSLYVERAAEGAYLRRWAFFR